MNDNGRVGEKKERSLLERRNEEKGKPTTNQLQGRGVRPEKKNGGGLSGMFRKQQFSNQDGIERPQKSSESSRSLPFLPSLGGERRTTCPPETQPQVQKQRPETQKRVLPSAEVSKHAPEEGPKPNPKRKVSSVQRPQGVPPINMGALPKHIPKKDDSLHVYKKTNVPRSIPPESVLPEMEVRTRKTSKSKAKFEKIIKRLLGTFHEKTKGNYRINTEKEIWEKAKWDLFIEEMENLQNEATNLSDLSASEVDKYELQRIEDVKKKMLANHGVLLHETTEKLREFKKIVLKYYQKHKVETNRKLDSFFRPLINDLRDLTHTAYALRRFLSVLAKIKENNPLTFDVCLNIITPEWMEVLNSFANENSILDFEKLQEETLSMARKLQKLHFSKSTPWQEPTNGVPLLLNSCENVAGAGNDKYGVEEIIFVNCLGNKIITITADQEKEGLEGYCLWPEDVRKGSSGVGFSTERRPITPKERLSKALTFLIEQICRFGIHPPLKSVTVSFLINQLLERKQSDRLASIEDYELYEQEDKSKYDEYIMKAFKNYKGEIFKQISPFIIKDGNIAEAFAEILKLITKKSRPNFEKLLSLIEPSKFKDFLLAFNHLLLNYIKDLAFETMHNLKKSIDKRGSKKGVEGAFNIVNGQFKDFVLSHSTTQATDLLKMFISSLKGKRVRILPDLDFLRAVEEDMQIPYISKLLKTMDFAPSAKFTDKFKEQHIGMFFWDKYQGPFNHQFRGQFTGKTLARNLTVHEVATGTGFFVSQLRNVEVYFQKNSDATEVNFAAMSVRYDTEFDASGFKFKIPRVDAIKILHENLKESKEKEQETEEPKEMRFIEYSEFMTILKRWRRVLGANEEFKVQQEPSFLLSPREYSGDHLLKELKEKQQNIEDESSDSEDSIDPKTEPESPVEKKKDDTIIHVQQHSVPTVSAMLKRTRSFSHPPSKDKGNPYGN